MSARAFGRTAVTIALLITACDTTEPPPPPPPPAIVARVEVRSPIGSAIATGASVSLEAKAYDQSGAELTRSFTWSVDNDNVAMVSGNGLVAAVSAGSVTVQAMTDGVSNSIVLVVADADLPSIAAILADPFSSALFSAIGGADETALRAAWTDCMSQTTTGNLEALQACLVTARGALIAHTDSEDDPLIGLVDLFVEWIDRFLNLP